MTRPSLTIRPDLIPIRTDIQGAIEFANELLTNNNKTNPHPWPALGATVLGPMLWLAARLSQPDLTLWLIDLPDNEKLATFWRQLDLTDPDTANAQQRLMAYLSGQHQHQNTLHSMFIGALQPQVDLHD